MYIGSVYTKEEKKEEITMRKSFQQETPKSSEPLLRG